MNAFQKLLSLGSQKAPKIINDVTKKTSKVIEPDEVIGKATKASPEAEEIAEAAWREVGPDADPVTYWDAIKRLAAERPKTMATGVAALGTAALMGLPGGDVTPPMAPPAQEQAEPKQILPDNYNDLAQAEANEMSDEVDPGVFKLLGIDPSKPKSKSDKIEESDSMDFSKAMQNAQSASNENQLMANLLRAGTQAGSAIAGLGAGANVKADYSNIEALEKTAGQPVSNIEKQMTTKASEMKLKKAQDDMNDEAKLRDPDSEISKLMAQLATKAGLVPPGSRVSGMALKNSGVNLGTLLSTIEAGKARKEAAALSRDLRADEKSSAREFKAEEDRKKREDKRKLVTEEIESRKRTIGDNIKRARDLVDKYGTVEMTGPEAELLQGMLDEIAVDTAKLQDPESVARPTEVQLVRKSLIPEDTLGRLGMTNETAKNILDKFEERINERAATGYKVRGIDQPTDRKDNTKDNNSKQSGMVKVLPPGGSKPKLIPASQLNDALAAGGKLVE